MNWPIGASPRCDCGPAVDPPGSARSTGTALGYALGAFALLAAATVTAHGATIQEHPIPTPNSRPAAITATSNATYWFTEGASGRVGMTTASGATTESAVLDASPGLDDITVGFDGRIWISQSVPPALLAYDPGSGATTSIPLGSAPGGIAVGQDLNIWVTDASGAIVRVSMSGNSPVVTSFPIPAIAGAADRIAQGPDGALWFTLPVAGAIGRIAMTGSVTTYALPDPGAGPRGIVPGPDGALWFTELNANRIGRITPSGTITEFPLPAPASAPTGITFGPDGALWFTESNPDRGMVGRISSDGSILEVPIPTNGGVPTAITLGTDGAVWFVETAGNMIARLDSSGLVVPQVTPAIERIPATGTEPAGNRLSVKIGTSARVTPTGTVTFSVGTATLATIQVVSGTAVLPPAALGAGAHVVSVYYSGDAVHLPARSVATVGDAGAAGGPLVGTGGGAGSGGQSGGGGCTAGGATTDPVLVALLMAAAFSLAVTGHHRRLLPHGR